MVSNVWWLGQDICTHINTVMIESDEVTLTLESNVKRRKKSLISVLNRRLVRSLHEVEICREEYEGNHDGFENKMIISQSMEKINTNYRASFDKNYQFKSMKDIKKVYYYNQSLTYTGNMKFFYSYFSNDKKLEKYYHEYCNQSKYDTLV